MENRRKQTGKKYQQKNQTIRLCNRKASLGSWQATVPSWEKKFCSTICSIPWNELLEAKKYIFLFEDIIQWDDSAGKEAFNNAKTRFWAMINGFPCNISLPCPDLYIDQIDWNSNVDPQLILDLEQEAEPIDCYSKTSILSSALLNNQPIVCTGWGDDDQEEQQKDTNVSPMPTNLEKNIDNNDIIH